MEALMRRAVSAGFVAVVLTAGPFGCNAIFGLDAGELMPLAAGGTGATGGGGSGGGSPCTATEPEACYDGPPETINIGDCHAGTRTCLASGYWGLCDGQVEPAPEICDDPLQHDEDCDGVACAAPLWSMRHGAIASTQGIYAMAADADGHIAIGGYFGGGQLSLGGACSPLTNGGAASSYDAFVALLSQSGTCMWAKRFGDPSADEIVTGLAVGAPGHLWVTGTFEVPVDFGGGPIPAEAVAGAGWDGFVLVLHLDDGSHAYSDHLARSGATGFKSPKAIAVNAQDTAFIVGTYTGPWCVTGICLTPDDESDGAAFVDKRSGPTHDEEWRFDLLGAGDQELTSAALGPDGSLAVGGFFTQGLAIAPEAATVTDSSQIAFVASLDPTDHHATWLQTYAPSTADVTQVVHGVAVDGQGRSNVVGAFFKAAVLGPGQPEVTAPLTGAAFVAQYSTSHDLVWAHTYQSAAGGIIGVDAVVVDSKDNLFLGGGYLGGDIKFGVSPLPSHGQFDVFLASFAADGTHRWSKGLGGSDVDYFGAIATGAGKLVVVGGDTKSPTFTLGGSPLAQEGPDDLFLGAFAP